ncbi:MAG: EF-Tu/IF-2/RF-3 family GTPase [Myxococcota bacterium]
MFDLLGSLDAPDDALDFPVVYASAKEGWATNDEGKVGADDQPNNLFDLYDAILTHVPPPYAKGSSRGAAAGFESRKDALAAPLQMQVTTIVYSEYVGRIAVGRVTAGRITAGQKVTVINRAGEGSLQRVVKLEHFDGLTRVEANEVAAGDICAVTGLDPIDIGDTIACPDRPEALSAVKIDEPTLTMSFKVNDSPFCGQDGDYVTSRQVYDRLERELQSNVALKVARDEGGEAFKVSGRGLMHLGVLLETMRREGYEVQVGKPEVILRRPPEGEDHAGKLCEPIEQLVVDCPSECQNDVMALVMNRKAEIVSMDPKAGAGDYIHMEFTIPARGLIGLRTRMLTATQGRAVMHHNLLRYEPMRGDVPTRPQGVMIASDPGQVTAYSLDRLYDRGIFFVKPGDQVYEGQIVGEHNKDNDITVNAVINKKHTNVRAAGSDDATRVKPARELSLEAMLEYIEEDELVECTPKFLRMRKRVLREAMRKREARAAKG